MWRIRAVSQRVHLILNHQNSCKGLSCHNIRFYERKSWNESVLYWIILNYLLIKLLYFFRTKLSMYPFKFLSFEWKYLLIYIVLLDHIFMRFIFSHIKGYIRLHKIINSRGYYIKVLKPEFSVIWATTVGTLFYWNWRIYRY